MSISENSTLLANNRENEGQNQLLDDRYNSSPAVNLYDGKSPYTDPDFVTLDVGPNHTIFRLHRTVLSQSPELEVKLVFNLWIDKPSGQIALPELDESTAHTLVHYLYSGVYQTLHSHDPSVKGGSLAAYKLGTCVYVASIRYKLPGLSDLSKEQINVSSEDLSILDILSVAREHGFQDLPISEEWYPEYIEAVVRAAFTKDPMFFTTIEIADQLEGDSRFRQVFMKALVGSLSSSTTAKDVGDVDDVEEVIVAEQSRAETPVVNESEQHGHEEVLEKEPEPEPEPETTSTVFLEDNDNIVLDAIEPTPSPPTKPEPFTDEVGFGASQTYRRFSRTNSSTEEPSAFPREENGVSAKRPFHERVDSLLQDVGNISLKQWVDKTEKHDTVAIVPEVFPDEATNETPLISTAKKNKRKKKKIAAAAAAAAAMAESLAYLDAHVVENGTVAA